MTARDVVVVGGGIVGAAVAYQAARRGLAVTLCEKGDLGLGASGRNPGFVWMHTRRPGPQLELGRLGRSLYQDMEEELGASFDFRPNGGLIFATTDQQLEVLSSFVRQRVEDGVQVSLLDRADTLELAPVLSDRVVGSSYCGEDAQITTLKVVRALAGAAARHGAEIRRGVEVTGIAVEGGRVAGVSTSEGRIATETVVLANGVWTPELARSLGVPVPITPMRLQVVSTSVEEPSLDVLLYGPRAIRQYDLFHDLPGYTDDLVPNDEDRDLPFLELACQTTAGNFLLGCPMDFAGMTWEPDLAGVAATCRLLPEAIPMLRRSRFERAWAGLLPHTPDSLPIVDWVPGVEGALITSGHVFGNSAGPATGVLAAEMLTGARPSIDLEPFRLDRPGLQGSGTRW